MPVELGIEVRDQLVTIDALGVRRVVDELARHEPAVPLVRAGDEPHAARRRHRIERDPHAHVLVAVDAVVGLVVVPRGALVSARLLHQRVLVEEAGGGRSHQLLRDVREPTVEHHPLVRGYVLPRDVVAPETHGLVGVRVSARPLARVLPVVLDTGRQQIDPTRLENPSQDRRAVAAKLFGRKIQLAVINSDVARTFHPVHAATPAARGGRR